MPKMAIDRAGQRAVIIRGIAEGVAIFSFKPQRNWPWHCRTFALRIVSIEEDLALPCEGVGELGLLLDHSARISEAPSALTEHLTLSMFTLLCYFCRGTLWRIGSSRLSF